MTISRFALAACLATLAGMDGAGWAQVPAQPVGAPPPAAAIPPTADGGVTAVEVLGSGQSLPKPPEGRQQPAHGDIAFNLPSSDVRVVAKAVLGDVLHVPYAVAPGLIGQVNAVTPYPIARQSVLRFLEEVLLPARMALVHQNGTYAIVPTDQAHGLDSGNDLPGYASDIVKLHYVGAAQLKALLDPVLPGVVTAIDADQGTITLTGTSGQRATANDIVSQFDVNWLRKMSFALYIPQHSDSRLIVPELDKLLNGPDAPTRSLVRLIAMEKLNGILAVTAQPQYLADVRRWIDVLDREGQNNEEQLFVYRVQNGRSKDLAKTLNMAFGMGGGGGIDTSSGASSGTQSVSNGSSGFGQASGGPGRSGQSGNEQGAFSLLGGSSGGSTPGSVVNSPIGATGSGARRLSASISSDDNNNAVVIFGTPHDYGIVLAALRKLDVRPYQVMLEAAITEVTLNKDMNYGVQWQFASGQFAGALTQTTQPLNLAQSGASNLVQTTPGFSLLFTHGASLSSVLNTLQTHTRINVVSAPKLLVLNNQTAALQVGDQVPILTQSATSNIAGSSTVNSVDYRDTGVILKITPRVNEGGLVMLDISQEVSSVQKTTSSGISSPTITTRKIATTVAVQDGEVIGLGGIILANDTRSKNGIPILSQIPVLGALFGNHQITKDRTELIVLIKPRVIRSVADGDSVTEQLREALKATRDVIVPGAMP